MPFSPKINYCINKNEDGYYLKFSDVTNVYDAISNTSGYEDVSTISGSDVTSALIEITNPENTILTFDVTSQIPSTVEGIIDFTNTITDQSFLLDGFYKVLYTITTASDTYTVCKEKYFYHNVKCCISNLTKEIINDPNNKNLYETFLKVKAWEFSFVSAASSLNKTDALNILELLKKHCKYNPCGCK